MKQEITQRQRLKITNNLISLFLSFYFKLWALKYISWSRHLKVAVQYIFTYLFSLTCSKNITQQLDPVGTLGVAEPRLRSVISSVANKFFNQCILNRTHVMFVIVVVLHNYTIQSLTVNWNLCAVSLVTPKSAETFDVTWFEGELDWFAKQVIRYMTGMSGIHTWLAQGHENATQEVRKALVTKLSCVLS